MKNYLLVDIAQSQIGVSEFPENSNKTKYGKWFGLDGVAWCGIFVSWCYDQAGASLGNIGFKKGFAGCQSAVAHFKATGEIVETPRCGDIVFFDWNGDGRYDHTGIFYGFHENQFISIEGNTAVGNDSNGGKVMKRIRNYKNALFVRPKVLNQLES
jgi:CHAP domain